jgi:four helix bundle protein
MHCYSFESLRVWQQSRSFVKEIYFVTRNFPESEKFGLQSQLQRAAVSIPANIAEGSGRNSMKDQAHFITIAYSSLMECLSLLILAKDLDFLKSKDYESLRDSIERISYQLNSYKNYLNSSG